MIRNNAGNESRAKSRNHTDKSQEACRIIIVDKLNDWKENYPDYNIITSSEYLDSDFSVKKGPHRVINFCSSYRYLSRGYYCSLIGEARKDRIMPSVKTIRNLSFRESILMETSELDSLLRGAFKKLFPQNDCVTDNKFSFPVFFGLADNKAFEQLARNLFGRFQAPLMRVICSRDKEWKISSIKMMSLRDIDAENEDFFIQSLMNHNGKRWQPVRRQSFLRYDLAILHDPSEKLPPSNKTALNNFIRLGKTLGIDVDLINQKDYNRLAEYDALFIRETTAVEHHTYLFSRRAQKEGIPVIDDPESILRCTNKVFLAELLRLNGIPIPDTEIYQKNGLLSSRNNLSYPVVLKIPEGAFSLGVFKAESPEELDAIGKRLFQNSEIILSQEYLYTDYDWRVGILNNKPLFAARYYMYRHHWQIYNHSARGRDKSGPSETIPVDDVPVPVITTALKAAGLIGTGLYGVDIKETEKGPVVIEVNDNPSIDEGIEDLVLKDELYLEILREFIRRIELPAVKKMQNQ